MPSATQIDHHSKTDTLSWSGTDDKALHPYTVDLEAEYMPEITTALDCWKDGMNGAPASVSQNTFPLTKFGSRLADLALNIHKGSGFAILRGLNTKEFSAEDNMLIYLGISSWVGSQRG